MTTDFEHLYDVSRRYIAELRQQLAAQHTYIAELEKQLEPGVVEEIREELGQARELI